MCSYFEKYRRCKFGSYCAYSHMKPRKHKVELEVEKLKKQLKEMKCNIEDLGNKLDNISSEIETKEHIRIAVW